MAKLKTYLARLSRGFKYYLGGLYRQLFEKDIFLWAQAIAFKVLIAIVPVLVLVTALTAELLDRWIEEGTGAYVKVSELIADYLPAYLGEDILGFLQAFAETSGTLFGVGLISLAFFAMTLFTTVRVVVSNVFQEDWHNQRTILGGYLFDLRMAAQVGLFFILSLGLTTALTALPSLGIEALRNVHLDYVWLREGWRVAIKRFGLIIPLLLSIAMFFQLFFFIPKPHPPKRSALIGAIVTALLWDAAKYGFTFYATQVGTFERYRSAAEEGLAAALGNTFGLIIAFVIWVYYSGIVLCIGAMVALLHEKRHRSKRERLAKKKLKPEKVVKAASPPFLEETSAAAVVTVERNGPAVEIPEEAPGEIPANPTPSSD